MNNLKSEHQQRVESFMKLAKQEVPTTPTEPSEQVRLLRAKLIFEEAIETIWLGLGVAIKHGLNLDKDCVEAMFNCEGPFNMEETIDGCCDLMVVTTGTLSALGVPDKPFQELVDNNNLAKFGAGHSWREDGKLIKPPGHKPPDIKGMLTKVQDNQGSSNLDEERTV